MCFILESRHVALDIGWDSADFGERREDSRETKRHREVPPWPTASKESHQAEKATLGVEKNEIERWIKRGTKEDSKEKRAGFSPTIP